MKEDNPSWCCTVFDYSAICFPLGILAWCRRPKEHCPSLMHLISIQIPHPRESTAPQRGLAAWLLRTQSPLQAPRQCQFQHRPPLQPLFSDGTEVRVPMGRRHVAIVVTRRERVRTIESFGGWWNGETSYWPRECTPPTILSLAN